MLADGCATASVKAVADRAPLLKRKRAGGDIRFVRLLRIDAHGGLGRNAVLEEPGRDVYFNHGRLRACAGKSGECETIQSGARGHENEQGKKRDDSLPRHLVLHEAHRLSRLQYLVYAI